MLRKIRVGALVSLFAIVTLSCFAQGDKQKETKDKTGKETSASGKDKSKELGPKETSREPGSAKKESKDPPAKEPTAKDPPPKEGPIKDGLGRDIPDRTKQVGDAHKSEGTDPKTQPSGQPKK
jgi:hypothetical protein